MKYLNYEDARVWWIPQVPSKPFHVSVDTTEKAMMILDTLAEYDLFQLANNIKPDYSNMGGLEVLEGGEWSEYHDDEDRDIDEIMKDAQQLQAQKQEGTCYE